MTSAHERLFLENLELIEKLIGALCRRSCCRAEEAEEFASWAKVKLIDNDYAVLRKFRGKSTLKTYMTSVLHNLFRDYRVQEWGRWRPSAKAKRLGLPAVQLETLVSRDGYGLDEAVEILRTNFNVVLGRRELESMAAELPARLKRRFEGEEQLEGISVDGDSAESRVVDNEFAETAARTQEHLDSALLALSPEERLILKMRYEDGFTVAQIASVLNLEPRPLYRRFERSLARLRRELEGRDVSVKEVLELVGWERFDLRFDFDGTGGENS